VKLKFLQQNGAERRAMILSGSIPRSLFMLALPTLMMGIVQSMMPLSDGLFINNVAGTLVASAVTYCQPILNMAVALSMGIGAAAMAMIGQANGRGETAEVKHIATQILVFSFLLGLCLVPVMFLVSFPVSAHVTPQIAHNVFLYIALNAAVLPFSFLESIYNAIKNSSGKPEATFVRAVIMLILKIIFNSIFIVWLRLGIVGCVLASFGANIIVCIWMYHELFIQKGEDRLELSGFHFDREVLRQLLRVGIPSMVTSVMLQIGFFLINNEVQKYGPVVLNGQGIANNITNICFNLPSAFGSAVTTMVSMNIGAGQSRHARKCMWIGCVFSMITAVLIIAIVVPLSPYLTVLFTRDREVLDIANRALHIYTYSVVGFGVCMVEQGAFIGLGRTKVPLVIGFLRIWALRYIFILCTESSLSFYSVFWGNLFSNYMAALISTLLIARVEWKSALDTGDSTQEKPHLFHKQKK
jgi:putative MATE family efflux protein